MQIYLDHYFEKDSVETDSATLGTLFSIATQNAMQGGVGIYNARAMLNLDVQDYLQIGLRSRRNTEQDEKNKNQFMVSPNPANTKCTLVFYKSGTKKIILTDIIGKQLQFFSAAFDETQLELDLTLLKAGSYTITVLYDELEKETCLLTVVK